MEEEISILIQHGGEWDSEHNFNNFVVDGLILKLDCNFETFLDELTKILGVYASADIVEIKFSVKHNYTPMKIFNDWSLKWYMNLKCKSSLTDYPLCLTVKERDCDLILSNGADVVLPPKGNIKPDRPQKKRLKIGGESKRKKSRITCSVCGQPDHNRQTCRNVSKDA
ncbi:hypothetical protein BC332_23050 [Capsicum chinense]|nr:hypothetical protein BC332_23050 [Capsicum chinense]